MVIGTLLGERFPPEKSAAFAIEHKARVSGGTDMGVLSRALYWAFGLKVTETDSIDVLRAALEQGCVAVVNVGGGTIERPQDFATREELAKVAAVMAQR